MALSQHGRMAQARDLQEWAESPEAFHHDAEAGGWEEHPRACAERLLTVLVKVPRPPLRAAADVTPRRRSGAQFIVTAVLSSQACLMHLSCLLVCLCFWLFIRACSAPLKTCTSLHVIVIEHVARPCPSTGDMPATSFKRQLQTVNHFDEQFKFAF